MGAERSENLAFNMFSNIVRHGGLIVHMRQRGVVGKA
jgi:hypothetical protein